MQIVAKLILHPLVDICIFFYIGNYDHLSYRAKKKWKEKKKYFTLNLNIKTLEYHTIKESYLTMYEEVVIYNTDV